MNSTYAFEADPLGTGRWQLMTSESSLQLSAARKVGKQKLLLKIHGHDYIYDLSSNNITQKNMKTGVVRKLRELPNPAFEFEASPGTWKTCDHATCEQLAAALTAKKTALLGLTIGSFMYDFEWGGSSPADWLAMKQKNRTTETERKVRMLQYMAFKEYSDWILFDDTACAAITEAVLLCKEELRIATSTAEYEIDLAAKHQTNVKTKFTRAIRLVGPFQVEEEESDALDDGQDEDEESEIGSSEESEIGSSEDDDAEDDGSGNRVVFACHEHPLRVHDKPATCCDIEGRHCVLEGTAWSCSEGCDFAVCAACWKELCHGVEVAGGPPGQPSDGSWVQYDAAAVDACREQLLLGKAKWTLEVKGAEYSVDFGAMQQTRVSTGAVRALRIVAAPGFPEGGAGCGGGGGGGDESEDVAVGEQVWFQEGGAAGAGERQLAVVTRVRDGGQAYTVKVNGKRASASREELTRVYEVWEFEDPAGSGEWKGVDALMARALATSLRAGRPTFRVLLPAPKGEAAEKERMRGDGGGATAEYQVDLLQMHQVRVSTGMVRGLRMAAEAQMISALCRLDPRQQRALEHVMSKAQQRHDAALPLLFQRCAGLGLTQDKVAAALLFIRNTVQIVIHVAAAHVRDKSKLLNDSHYRNQFETGTSGGLLSLKKREEWERDLFGGAYDGCDASLRPKYGVANVVMDPRGIKKCSQYGECFLELSPAARRRCTLSGADSGGIKDERLATCQHYAHVLQADYDNAELMALVLVANRMPLFMASETISKYKEVQIHGPVRLDADVVALHVPESEDDATLQSFAKRNGIRYYTFGQALNSCTLKGL